MVASHISVPSSDLLRPYLPVLLFRENMVLFYPSGTLFIQLYFQLIGLLFRE
jgi:hypothetical protein